MTRIVKIILRWAFGVYSPSLGRKVSLKDLFTDYEK